MDLKVGDLVEIHSLGSGFSEYDRSFNGLRGRVTSVNVEPGRGHVRVYFFKGQRRRWGEFSYDFVRPLSALDALAFEVFKSDKVAADEKH
jgi:hypothetical protein